MQNSLNPACILIVESWLQSGIIDTIIDMPDYTLYRADRVGKIGGAVCAFLKDEVFSV